MIETIVGLPNSLSSVTARGDGLRKAGNIERAIEAYLTVAAAMELPPASICLRLLAAAAIVVTSAGVAATAVRRVAGSPGQPLPGRTGVSNEPPMRGWGKRCVTTHPLLRLPTSDSSFVTR